MRAAGSLVLLTSYILHDFEAQQNHWALFEAWVVAASYILAMATKFGTPKKWWLSSFDLCLQATARSLEGLLAECETNATKFVNLDLVDGHFYGNRISILSGLLGAYDLFSQNSLGKPPNEFVRKFLDQYLRDAKIWGESAVPFLTVAALAMESHGRQRNAEALIFQLAAAIAASNRARGPGIPNPYYGAEEAFRITAGLDRLRQETFDGLAYTLEPLVQFLARRWLRRHLGRIWDQVTRAFYASFCPEHEWEWFVWKARKGALHLGQPGRPQSWTKLLEEAESPSGCAVPELLTSRPEFAVFFILVFPHRFQPRILSMIERWIDNSKTV